MKAVTITILILALIGVPFLVFMVRTVKAGGTIYILSDGSIDPPNAPISSVDRVIYTLVDDITDSIRVERINVVIDGDGHKMQCTEPKGSVTTIGIYASNVRNVTIKNIEIRTFFDSIRFENSVDNTVTACNLTDSYNDGIVLSWCHTTRVFGNNIMGNSIGVYCSSLNRICGNNITNNSVGVLCEFSTNETIDANNIANNGDGIELFSASRNRIVGNNIRNNQYGIRLSSAFNNSIYHNNIINNTHQRSTYDSINMWDNGYPSGGNYWSDYGGLDEKAGSNQDRTGSDGVGDKPYEVDAINKDHYPLMNPWKGSIRTDLNGDGIVNVIDVSIVAAPFGAKVGDANWNQVADIDKNEIINIIDITLVARDCGKAACFLE